MVSHRGPQSPVLFTLATVVAQLCVCVPDAAPRIEPYTLANTVSCRPPLSGKFLTIQRIPLMLSSVRLCHVYPDHCPNFIMTSFSNALIWIFGGFGCGVYVLTVLRRQLCCRQSLLSEMRVQLYTVVQIQVWRLNVGLDFWSTTRSGGEEGTNGVYFPLGWLPGGTYRGKSLHFLLSFLLPSLSLLSPLSLSLSFLLRLSVDGHFPLSISKFQVEKDHSFLLQTELESLIRSVSTHMLTRVHC